MTLRINGQPPTSAQLFAAIRLEPVVSGDSHKPPRAWRGEWPDIWEREFASRWKSDGRGKLVPR